MSDTMRAFVIKEVGRGRGDGEAHPEPGPEEAIVKTTAALICTSDAHTVGGRAAGARAARWGTRRSGSSTRWAGRSRGFREGDRVAVNAVTPLLPLQHCQRGFTWQCSGVLGG